MKWDSSGYARNVFLNCDDFDPWRTIFFSWFCKRAKKKIFLISYFLYKNLLILLYFVCFMIRNFPTWLNLNESRANLAIFGWWFNSWFLILTKGWTVLKIYWKHILWLLLKESQSPALLFAFLSSKARTLPISTENNDRQW